MIDRILRWSQAALDDIERIADYIALEDSRNAERVMDRLLSRAASLERFAARGRRVPGLANEDEREYRELIESSWRIIYWIDSHNVSIVAVVDCRRDLESWLQESADRIQAEKS